MLFLYFCIILFLEKTNNKQQTTKTKTKTKTNKQQTKNNKQQTNKQTTNNKQKTNNKQQKQYSQKSAAVIIYGSNLLGIADIHNIFQTVFIYIISAFDLEFCLNLINTFFIDRYIVGVLVKYLFSFF